MATIAELQTKLTVDNSEFKRGIESAQKSVKGFSDKAKIGFAAAAAVVTAGMVGAVNALSKTMDEAEKKASELVDTATRLGAGIPELQRLQYAAQQSGISVESMNGALGKLLKTVGNAANGSKEAAAAFEKLGLNAATLATMGVDQQYIAISEAIKGLATPAEQAAAAVAIFGRNGIQQLSLIKDDVKGLVNEFKGLGVELTANQAKSLEAYGDSASKLATVWDGFKNQLAAALAGPFKKLLDWIIDSSIQMGGLGNIAKSVAEFILNATSSLVGFFGGVYRGIQSSIIAVEELLVLLLKVSQYGTLGLSNINLPGGLGGAGDKIQSLRSDINQRSARILGAQDAQNKIQVEIKAASGFVAEVVNSNENRNMIATTVNNQFSAAAAEIQR